MVTFLPLNKDKNLTLAYGNIVTVLDFKGFIMFSGDLLSYAMKNAKMTNARLAEIAKAYGIKKSEDAFKSYRQGRAVPPPALMEIIANSLDATVLDFDDNGDAKKQAIANSEIKKNKELYAPLFPEIQAKDNMIRLPLIHAGAGAEAILDSSALENIYIEKRLLHKNQQDLITPNTMAIRVVGDSMKPNINENDVLFVDMVNGRNFVTSDAIYLVRFGDSVQIKQVQFLGDGSINLISANSVYPIVNEKNNWEILGKPFMKWGVEYFSNLEIL